MNAMNPDHPLVAAVRKEAVPFSTELDFDLLVAAAADKELVLIGEATHGTREFYRLRAQITQRLIVEHGFDTVAVEADWPDAYTVHRYVCGLSDDVDADEALADFERFPVWMWRNREVQHFVEWLRAHNTARRDPVGFYGLDLYSMNTSMHAVVAYLGKVDPLGARRARQRYACLDHFMDRPQAYGYATEMGMIDSCEREIIAQIEELRRKSWAYLRQNGGAAEEEYFSATQNALLVRAAEQYYRALFRGRPDSWNLRDKHMFTTLEQLTAHRGKQLNRKSKTVVWAHNSHIGNASATEMALRGEYNIGQMTRSGYGARALLVGFSTCRGTVRAAADWDEPAEVKEIMEPLAGSYEQIFHLANGEKFFLDLRQDNTATDMLREHRLLRAIGVVYKPETERYSHYVYSCLPKQFDFIIHFDRTTAVEPIETIPHVHRGEMDETYPSGI
ncbi:MAG: erythromycin esterase family protein [Alphaproteobacteria bacterium]|nr:erythromycin esterase family protein [Alphaproteobacteria bacterium]